VFLACQRPRRPLIARSSRSWRRRWRCEGRSDSWRKTKQPKSGTRSISNPRLLSLPHAPPLHPRHACYHPTRPRPPFLLVPRLPPPMLFHDAVLLNIRPPSVSPLRIPLLVCAAPSCPPPSLFVPAPACCRCCFALAAVGNRTFVAPEPEVETLKALFVPKAASAQGAAKPKPALGVGLGAGAKVKVRREGTGLCACRAWATRRKGVPRQ
jgi:hypothetical protein